MKGINLGEPNTSLEERRLKVELDKKALYALASDTRIEILKALQTDRRTVSQLAELLEADKAGVHRHLKKLEEGGFVSRDEDHGFVYYSLTWKARDLISPGENTKIIVLISSAFFLLLVIGLVLMSAPLVHTDGGSAEFSDNNQTNNGGTVTEDGGSGWSWTSVTAVAVMAILIPIVLFFTYRIVRRPRQTGAENAELAEPLVKRDISD